MDAIPPAVATAHLSKKLGVLLLSVAAVVVTACSDEKAVTLGFVAGTSGRVADLGMEGRNGFLLAIEQQNARGGIHRKSIEAILKDDRQNPARVKLVVQELLEANVDAIIGPMTSAMALASADLVNNTDLVLMAATVTTNALTGLDDQFLRTLAPVKSHASVTARYVYNHHHPATAKALIDLDNEAYTRDWLEDYREAYEKNGGTFLGMETFRSGNNVDFVALADKLLQDSPELVVLVMNSVDAALMAKAIHTRIPDALISAAEWAGTERLIELGGSYVEGLYVAQYHDRASTDERYLKFREAYFRRFGQEPGFPSIATYNSTNIVLQALRNKSEAQTLKKTILDIGEFQGVQGKIVFDAYGDVKSKTYVTRVIDGKFVVLE